MKFIRATISDIQMSSRRPHEGNMSNKRRKRTSEVWKYFDETPDSQTAICKNCGKSLSGNSKGGTSHLNRHLKLCMEHPTGDIGQPVTLESTHEARNIDDVGQPVALESNHEAINIGDVSQPITLESTHEARDIGLTRDITWKDEVQKAILAEIPFASSDFKKCWYSLTGLTDIENEICAYYESEKKKLATKLKNLPSRVSFSFQIEKELGYISITAHFINEDFNLVRRLIGFKKLIDLESKSCIVDAIKSCISDWNLGDKIFTFIGGDNSYDMQNSLKDCFHKLLLDGLFINYECRKEALNNFYTYSIGPLCYHEKSNIDKVVRHVKGGSSRMATFNKLAEERGLTPINIDWLNEYAGCSWDVKSKDLGHWKPALEMFKQALAYKDVFNQCAEIEDPSMTVNGENSMLDNGHSSNLDNIGFSSLDTHVEVSQSPHSELNMCSIDWESVEKVIHFSDLLPKVIDGLSTSNYPTSNLYIPNLEEIEHIIMSRFGEPIQIEKSDGKETYDLGEYSFNYLEQYFSLFEIATVLDPRYRLEFVKCSSDDFVFTDKKEFCEDVFHTYDEINEGSPECIKNTNTQEQGSSSNSPHMIGGTIANKFYKYVKEKKKTRKSELDKYLGDELVELDDASFNILSWWKQNRSQYPVLSRMARDFLAMPTCVHSIEDIINSDFGLLEDVSPQVLEAVICSKDWILFDVRSVSEAGNR